MITEYHMKALDRAIEFLRATGHANESADDLYGGLMWHDDAEVLEKLRFELDATRPQAVDAQPDEADKQPPEQHSEQSGIKDSLTTDERWEPDGDLGHDEAHVRESLDEATAIAQATGQYPASADEALSRLEQHAITECDLHAGAERKARADIDTIRRALRRPRVPDEVRALPQELRDFAQNFILAEQYETAEQIGEMAASARRAIRASEGSDDG